MTCTWYTTDESDGLMFMPSQMKVITSALAEPSQENTPLKTLGNVVLYRLPGLPYDLEDTDITWTSHGHHMYLL
jgi:hypothetical protein